MIKKYIYKILCYFSFVTTIEDILLKKYGSVVTSTTVAFLSDSSYIDFFNYPEFRYLDTKEGVIQYPLMFASKGIFSSPEYINSYKVDVLKEEYNGQRMIDFDRFKERFPQYKYLITINDEHPDEKYNYSINIDNDFYEKFITIIIID